MKTLLLAAVTLAAVSSAHAVGTTNTYIGTATGVLNVDTNWSLGTAAGSGDVATFTGSTAYTGLTFGTDTSWSGINYGVNSATYTAVVIAAAGSNITRSITLGADGVNLTAGNLILNSNTNEPGTNANSNKLNLVLSADQTWTAASGSTFKVQGSNYFNAGNPTATAELNAHTLTIAGAGTSQFTGSIIKSTGGTGTINLTDTSTLLFASISTDARVNVNSSVTVNVASGTTLKLHDSTSTSTFAQTTNLNGGKLDGSGNNTSNASGAINLGAGTTSILTASGAGLTISGLIGDATPGSAGNLTISAPSRTVTLSNAANSYTGTTTVTAGTLNIAAAGRVLVSDSSGINVTAGALIVNGKLMLTAADASIANAGTITLNATSSVLDLGSFFNGQADGSTYQLITGTTSTTGTFNSILFDTNAFSSVSFSNATGQLTFTAVPEPSTYGLIGAGSLAAVAFVRRRRKTLGVIG